MNFIIELIASYIEHVLEKIINFIAPHIRKTTKKKD